MADANVKRVVRFPLLSAPGVSCWRCELAMRGGLRPYLGGPRLPHARGIRLRHHFCPLLAAHPQPLALGRGCLALLHSPPPELSLPDWLKGED